MTKLAPLMEWLSLKDAAVYLSSKLDDEITEARILQLGQQRDLTLSFRFVNSSPALLGTVALIDGRRAIGFPRWHGASRWNWLPPDNSVKRPEPPAHFKFNDEIDWINGVWDLLMTEDADRAVEHAFQKMTGGPEVLPSLGDGIVVTSIDGRFAELQEVSAMREPQPYHRHNYKLTRYLPAGGALVVRSSSLLEFDTPPAISACPS